MYDCHPQPSNQLPFDQGVQISIYPKFNGLCTRTDRSHLAVFCINRNAIGCYDFVRIHIPYFSGNNGIKQFWWVLAFLLIRHLLFCGRIQKSVKKLTNWVWNLKNISHYGILSDHKPLEKINKQSKARLDKEIGNHI